jgi:hypothetical protein
VGCDAKLIGMVDVCWKGKDNTPTVTATMEPSTKWTPDEKLQVRHDSAEMKMKGCSEG